MSAIRELGKNTILIFIGNLGSKFVGFLMLPFYTRWLSQEDYGTTDIIFVYSSLLLGVTTCCIADAIFIFPKNSSINKQKRYFTTGAIFSFITLILTGVIFIGLENIFQFYDISNSFTNYTWWIYTILIVTFTQNFIQQFCRSINKIILYSISGVILTILTALFSFIFIPKYGIFGYLLATTISLTISSFSIFLLAQLYSYFRFSFFDKKLLKEMLSYSCPLIPNTIMWWSINSLNRPFLESNVGLAGIGILAVAQKIPNMISIIFNVFSSAWQISVLNEYKEKNFLHFFNRIMSGFEFLITILIIILSPLADFIMRIIVGPQFYEASKYLPILTITIFFLSINIIISPIFSAVRKSKYFFNTSIYGAISSVISYIILIPRLGLWGAVMGICIAQAVMAFMRLIYSTKYVDIFNKKIYLIYLLSILTTTIASTFLTHSIIKYIVCISCIVISTTYFLITNKQYICNHLKLKS